ncbi:MAG: GntR family transcriptional regulator [Mycoplasmatales bacterium]|nr:GntR family transcriptional regulator [Mycoplasmatales bacterium]
MTIKDYIGRYINLKLQSNEWKPGDKIISEQQLAIKFDCSRSTVRQALSSFVYSGALIPSKGRGYIVSNDANFKFLESFSSRFKLTDIFLEEIEFSERIINKLKIDENENIFLFVKKYYKDEELVAAQITALNKNVFWEIDSEAIKKSISKEILKQGITVEKIKIHLKMIESSKSLLESEAIKLNWKNGELIEEDITLLSKGKFIERTIRVINKNYFDFVFHKNKRNTQ